MSEAPHSYVARLRAAHSPDAAGADSVASFLRAPAAWLRLLMEGSDPLFFFVHDLEGVFEYLSPSVESVVGYRPEEMIGRSYEAFHPAGAIRDEVRRRTEEGLRGEVATSVYEAVLRRKDGSLVHLEITESPLEVDGQVVGMRGFGRDVTTRKRLEEELRQSQKMEAVGRLAGGVAHDFNNLLTSIMGNVRLALEGLEASHPVRDELEEVRRSSERAAQLTGQLLAFSRKQVLRPHVIDLNEVVLELKRLLERLLGEDVDLRTDLCADPLCVLADRGQLEQVLMNLAVNARDAMPHGGALRIRTRRWRGRLGAEQDGEAGAPEPLVRLSVTDTGLGMDEAVRGRIFEPFFTTKEQGRGTGLGLSTVYGIVAQSGGAVHVESAPGQGSTFHVDLREVRGRLPAVVRPPIEEVNGGGGRILVVEDEEGVRRLCVKLLRRHGYEVWEAADGRSALDHLERDGRPFDVVVTDMVMPGMSGRELVREIRGRWPDVGVVVMSGYTGEAIERHRVLEVSRHFLQKPFTSEELLRMVAEVLPRDSTRPLGGGTREGRTVPKEVRH